MARMYPQRLPDAVESSAERLLYQQFETQLPDTFIVMHSVKWLVRDRRHHDHDGEIDFLIVHRDLGILVLEVKGGRLRVDGVSGHWFTKDRFDRETLLKSSPFDQAQKNLYNLKAKLQEAPKTRPYEYRMQRGVAFPDITVGQTDIGLYGDRELMLDSTDILHLEAAIRRIMGMPTKQYALSEYAIKALIDLLQPTLEISRIGLGSQVISAEQRIATLTESQFAILDILQSRPQAAVSGCAGSGKTMLAMEKARRLANEGFQVLFTCYNKNLAQWVRDRFKQDPYVVNERIYVAHYHGLARELCRRAGVHLPSEPTGNLEECRSYFNEILPERFQEAISKSPVRFDAIIADEGQDFAELWWVTLLDLLNDRDRSIFYIFYDDNQRIYAQDTALPLAELPYRLSINCRNTDRIHERVLQYYQGSPRPTSKGPAGVPPEVILIDEKGERETLRRVFTKLFTEEKLPPTNVVVLTPRSERTSIFKEGDRFGNMTLTWEKQPGPRQVLVGSIYGFKGLESPVVVLAELDKVQSAHSDYLLYVATSRARDHLIVLGRFPDSEGVTRALGAEERWLEEDFV